jgi:hypothetical protein
VGREHGGRLIAGTRLALAQQVIRTKLSRVALLMPLMMTIAWPAKDESYRQAGRATRVSGSFTPISTFGGTLSALCVDCSAAIRPGVDGGWRVVVAEKPSVIVLGCQKM